MTRQLIREDLPTVAGMLARALVDDPGWIHVFPDDTTRLAKMEKMLGLVARIVYLPGKASWVVDDGLGAALWERPGEHGVGVLTSMRLVPRLAWWIGKRTRAALKMFGEMERHHPKEPHHYLAVLGVDPAHQGRGLGPRLLEPVFGRADDARQPCWLESTNPKNHTFYTRVGFEVADQQPIEGGPTITFFVRRPR